MQAAEAVHFSIFWFLKITKQIKFKFCFHLLLGLSLSNCPSEYTYVLIYIYIWCGGSAELREGIVNYIQRRDILVHGGLADWLDGKSLLFQTGRYRHIFIP